MFDNAVVVLQPSCYVDLQSALAEALAWYPPERHVVVSSLCETHHHLVHEGGWSLTIDEHRRVTWTRPGGTIWLTDPGPNRTRPRARPPSGVNDGSCERVPSIRPEPPPPARLPDLVEQATLL